MEDKIKQMLDDYGLTESQLTSEELDKLKEEIKAKEQGLIVLDSVLDNPSLFYRFKKQTAMKRNSADVKDGTNDKGGRCKAK